MKNTTNDFNFCAFEDWMNGILKSLDPFSYMGNLDAPIWMPAGSTESGAFYGPDEKGSSSIINRELTKYTNTNIYCDLE
jgi:hypothetical protein